MYLIYIGLYQQHVILLRTNLIALFTVDEIRRIFTEALIPYLFHNKDAMSAALKKQMSKAAKSFEKQLSGRKSAPVLDEDSFGSDEDMTEDPSALELAREEAQRKKNQKLQEIITEEIKELEKDEIEMFDQYLEMIMTFGYITMFAAAFPFGATLTSLFVYFESKNDMFVLTSNSRRPFVTKMVGIGVWEYTLDFFTFVSIFTNIFLCCYASN